MAADEPDPPGGQAGALGFYFNADDTWRTGPATPEPWEPARVEAEAEDRPQEAPARRRGSRLLIALALALIAGAAVALGWSLTADRRSPPAPPAPVAPQLPPAARPPDTSPAAMPAPALTETPADLQRVRPADRPHAAAAHAGRPRHRALKPSKAHASKSAPAAAHGARPAHTRSGVHASRGARSSPAPCRTRPCR
jgi:hypothetical protein